MDMTDTTHPGPSSCATLSTDRASLSGAEVSETSTDHAKPGATRREDSQGRVSLESKPPGRRSHLVTKKMSSTYFVSLSQGNTSKACSSGATQESKVVAVESSSEKGKDTESEEETQLSEEEGGEVGATDTAKNDVSDDADVASAVDSSETSKAVEARPISLNIRLNKVPSFRFKTPSFRFKPPTEEGSKSTDNEAVDNDDVLPSITRGKNLRSGARSVSSRISYLQLSFQSSSSCNNLDSGPKVVPQSRLSRAVSARIAKLQQSFDGGLAKSNGEQAKPDSLDSLDLPVPLPKVQLSPRLSVISTNDGSEKDATSPFPSATDDDDDLPPPPIDDDDDELPPPPPSCDEVLEIGTPPPPPPSSPLRLSAGHKTVSVPMLLRPSRGNSARGGGLHGEKMLKPSISEKAIPTSTTGPKAAPVSALLPRSRGDSGKGGMVEEEGEKEEGEKEVEEKEVEEERKEEEEEEKEVEEERKEEDKEGEEDKDEVEEEQEEKTLPPPVPSIRADSTRARPTSVRIAQLQANITTPPPVPPVTDSGSRARPMSVRIAQLQANVTTPPPVPTPLAKTDSTRARPASVRIAQLQASMFVPPPVPPVPPLAKMGSAKPSGLPPPVPGALPGSGGGMHHPSPAVSSVRSEEKDETAASTGSGSGAVATDSGPKSVAAMRANLSAIPMMLPGTMGPGGMPPRKAKAVSEDDTEDDTSSVLQHVALQRAVIPQARRRKQQNSEQLRDILDKEPQVLADPAVVGDRQPAGKAGPGSSSNHGGGLTGFDRVRDAGCPSEEDGMSESSVWTDCSVTSVDGEGAPRRRRRRRIPPLPPIVLPNFTAPTFTAPKPWLWLKSVLFPQQQQRRRPSSRRLSNRGSGKAPGMKGLSVPGMRYSEMSEKL